MFLGEASATIKGVTLESTLFSYTATEEVSFPLTVSFFFPVLPLEQGVGEMESGRKRGERYNLASGRRRRRRGECLGLSINCRHTHNLKRGVGEKYNIAGAGKK